jgi:hypothetical protein
VAGDLPSIDVRRETCPACGEPAIAYPRCPRCGAWRDAVARAAANGPDAEPTAGLGAIVTAIAATVVLAALSAVILGATWTRLPASPAPRPDAARPGGSPAPAPAPESLPLPAR